MNYVIWDIETDSAQLDWATMIEVGAILLDENFKEKERFSARCRMPQDRVPSATALCSNKSNVDLITKGNLSHYEMISQLEKTQILLRLNLVELLLTKVNLYLRLVLLLIFWRDGRVGRLRLI